MKKLLLILFSFLLLGACSFWKDIEQPIIQSKFLAGKDSCPDDMMTIYATGTKMAIDCVPLTPTIEKTPQSVSAEIDYTSQKNLINLSDLESEKIVNRLIEKQEQENKKQNNTGVFIQGNWTAVYNPPKYPDGYDSIVVTMPGKTYTFPGVYGKEERSRYLERIGSWSGCISYIQWPNPEQWTENVLIKWTYYYPPNHGDCMSWVRTFWYFDSFSPSGYYLIYRVYWWEWSEVRMIDIQTGKNILGTRYNSQSMITWTLDNKQMLYYSEWWEDRPAGMYLTRAWDFPHADKILEPRVWLVSIDIDEKYLYTLEFHQDYYLRILDRMDYQEVYTRIVKK